MCTVSGAVNTQGFVWRFYKPFFKFHSFILQLTSSATLKTVEVEAVVVGAVGDGEVAVGGEELVAVPVFQIHTQFIGLCGGQGVESVQTWVTL